VVRSIIELLEVQNDEPEEIHLPVIEKQGDETNMDWMARFGRATKVAKDSQEADAGGVEADFDTWRPMQDI